MGLNRKGQTLAMAIMSSIFVLIVGFMVINFLMPEITTFRVSLECSSASTISDGAKLLCLATGTTIPYWIVVVLSLVVGGITARFVF